MKYNVSGVVVVTLRLGADPVARALGLIPGVRGGGALIGSQAEQIILTGKQDRLSLVLPVLTLTHVHTLTFTDQTVMAMRKNKHTVRPSDTKPIERHTFRLFVYFVI